MPAPRVVLLHGLGADHRAFQRFQRLLPQDWEVHALDLLGHGDATKPAHGYAMDDHGAYIAGELECTFGASLATDAPVLVGHSYGAATSVVVAATRPELVRAVVLLDPIVEPESASQDGETKTEQMIRAKREGHLRDTVDRLFPREGAALRSWTVQTWESMALGVVDELDRNWMRFADRVTCPVTIVHGDLELGGGGDLAADWFDEPVVVRIAGAGHYLHATHAREVAAVVTDAVTNAY